MKNQEKGNDWSRRQFLKLNTLLGLGLISGSSIALLNACGGNAGIDIPEGADYFDHLRLLQKAIQNSPDFLPARAVEAVETKDPEKIFAFVRDQIQTLPNQVNYKEIDGDNFRQFYNNWGTDGCLRYGGGTMYDKAELLVQLLEDAGFQAKIVSGTIDETKVNWKDILLGDFNHEFKVNVDNALFKIKDHPIKKGSIQAVDLNDSTVEKTAKTIINTLPSDHNFADPNWAHLTKKVFEVKLVQEDKEQTLNPSVPTAKIDDSYIKGSSRNTSYRPQKQEVEISLSLGQTDAPNKPIPFVKGKFPLHVLYKHQVTIGFQSNLDVEDLLLTQRQHLKMLTPYISLTGALSEEELKKYYFNGNTIHLNGDIIEATEKGLLVNGDPVEQGEEHPALRKKVQSIEAEVNASRFPQMEVFLNPKNNNDELIEGLDGVDFEIYENEKPVAFSFKKHKKNNEIDLGQANKILLCFDLSASVPKKFLRDGMVELGTKLFDEFHKENPGTSFKIAWYYKKDFFVNETWLNDREAVIQELEKIKRKADPSSFLWEHLANATEQGADIVAFISDGISLDKENPELSTRIQAGSPTLFLATVEHKANLKTMKKMATRANGKVVKIMDHEETIQAIKNFSLENTKYRYTIAYSSICDDQKERNISIKIKDQITKKDLTYQRPPSSCQATTAWSGIYLNIKYENYNVTRTLAGKILFSSEKDNPTTAEHIAATEAGLFGNYRLIFEGGRPTFSNILNELINAKLSQEKFLKAAGKDKAATIDAIEEGFYNYPKKYALMQHAFAKNSSKDHITYQNGFNATLYSLVPRGADGVLMEKLDILPFTQYRTIHQDPKKAFELNLKHSLQYMNLEKLNYQKSGLGELESIGLEYYNKNAYRKKLLKLRQDKDWDQWATIQQSTNTFNSWLSDSMLLSNDGKSYFSLHSNSGTVIAHSFSGAGAGVAETQEVFAQVNDAITVFNLIANMLATVSPAFKVWVMLEKAKMKWLEKATIAIITMQGMSDEAFNETLNETLCNAALDVATGFGGNLLDRLGQINDILGLLDLPSLGDCGIQNLPE